MQLHDKYTLEYNKKEQYHGLMSSIDARNLYEQMKKETVPCNLCGATDLVDVVSCDRYGMGLYTVMCKNCGFLFTNPRPIEAEMNRFYRESYRDFYFNAPDPSKNDYLISEVRNTAVKRANWLFDFVEEELDAQSISQVTVLDAGCGDGSFLTVVRSKIPDSKLFGIEPSQAYARFAVQRSMAGVYIGDIVSFFNERQSQGCLFNLIRWGFLIKHGHRPAKGWQRRSAEPRLPGIVLYGKRVSSGDANHTRFLTVFGLYQRGALPRQRVEDSQIVGCGGFPV